MIDFRGLGLAARGAENGRGPGPRELFVRSKLAAMSSIFLDLMDVMGFLGISFPKLLSSYRVLAGLIEEPVVVSLSHAAQCRRPFAAIYMTW